MKPEDVIQQTLEAWDEIVAEEETPSEPAPEEGPNEEPEEQDEPEIEEEETEEEADETEEEETEDDSEEGDEEEPLVSAAFETDDPEIQAFLAKYQGDLPKALRGAVELSKVIGRQGSEKAALAERAAELEAQLQQATAFQAQDAFFQPDQLEWIEEAVNSQNPTLYMQRAVQQGEFGLARAVAREWAREQPFEALRAGQQIDRLEQAQQQQQAPAEQAVDRGVLVNVLAENFPDMRAYEAQMVEKLQQWGPEHPLVIDARSGDIPTAAKAIIALYEAARSSSASVQGARDGLKRKHRQQADDVREAAVVSSSSATPSAGATPRQRPILPGLTREAFEAEFSQQ